MNAAPCYSLCASVHARCILPTHAHVLMLPAITTGCRFASSSIILSNLSIYHLGWRVTAAIEHWSAELGTFRAREDDYSTRWCRRKDKDTSKSVSARYSPPVQPTNQAGKAIFDRIFKSRIFGGFFPQIRFFATVQVGPSFFSEMDVVVGVINRTCRYLLLGKLTHVTFPCELLRVECERGCGFTMSKQNQCRAYRPPPPQIEPSPRVKWVFR